MKVAFRVDASCSIGSGHVMRCLNLANELKDRGAEVEFICRNLSGHLAELVKKNGFSTILLVKPDNCPESDLCDQSYQDWLETQWQDDANETIKQISGKQVNWLVVDHYSIDWKWHQMLRSHTEGILIVDDLANRKLDCDIVLNQTSGLSESQYSSYVSNACQVILGAKFALLDSMFSGIGETISSHRDSFAGIRSILIFMGGMDLENSTCRILDVLSKMKWVDPPDVEVILLSQAPHLDQVINRSLDRGNLNKITVHTDVENMVEFMTRADLAIGAAGAASWERCATGLPSFVNVVAENQRMNASYLESKGAAYVWELECELRELIYEIQWNVSKWFDMSRASKSICDGGGCRRVADLMAPHVVN